MDGNDNAFRFVVERFMDDVSRTVTGMLGPVPEVDDVVQEVFIKLHRSLASFRGDASLKTFVVRMAINKSLDALRKRKRAAWLKPWTDVQEFEHQTTEGSDTEITSRERRSELRNAINKLPENQRAVIVLRLIEEISTEETSRILHEQEQRAHDLLTQHRKGLEAVAEKLIEEETIDGATVGQLIQESLDTPTSTSV